MWPVLSFTANSIDSGYWPSPEGRLVRTPGGVNGSLSYNGHCSLSKEMLKKQKPKNNNNKKYDLLHPKSNSEETMPQGKTKNPKTIKGECIPGK